MNINKNFCVKLKSAAISNKKIKYLSHILKGYNIQNAISLLSVQKIKAAFFLHKLIYSALCNILNNNNNININNIFIKNIYANKGKNIKKIFKRSQGRADYIKKKKSNIFVYFSISGR